MGELKMSNKIKVASASAAVLASLILVNANLTNEVKADTKPANTSSKAQTPEEAAKANIASVQKEVDSEQANTDKAKAALDQAKKMLKNQMLITKHKMTRWIL